MLPTHQNHVLYLVEPKNRFFVESGDGDGAKGKTAESTIHNTSRRAFIDDCETFFPTQKWEDYHIAEPLLSFPLSLSFLSFSHTHFPNITLCTYALSHIFHIFSHIFPNMFLYITFSIYVNLVNLSIILTLSAHLSLSFSLFLPLSIHGFEYLFSQTIKVTVVNHGMIDSSSDPNQVIYLF